MAREVSSDFLRIDLTDGKTRKVISACQSDTIQRTLHFLVVNAGKPLDLTNLFYAEIIVKRTDGTYLDNACVIDGNDIQYTLKSTDVAVIGENEAHLLLSFKDGTVKETPTFYLNVFSTFYNPSAIQSQSEYTALVNKVLDAQEAANDALESKNSAEAAAADAADSADEAGSYVEIVSQYTSEAENHASTAEFYASEAGSILASASDVASEVEAVSEYMSTTSEYLESASEYASEAQSHASDVGGYIASASEYASTAASEADKGSGYITSLSTTGDEYISSLSSMASEYSSTETGYLTSTSEYASAAASEASVANSCAVVAEAAAYDNAQDISALQTEVSTLTSNLAKAILNFTTTPSSLADFVSKTSQNTNQMVYFRFADLNNVMGFGVNWVKGFVFYQNSYNTTYSVGGCGIVYHPNGTAYLIYIDGSSTAPYTLTKKQIVRPSTTLIDTSTLKVTQSYDTVVASFINTGILNGDNLGAALRCKPLKPIHAIVVDSISSTFKVIALNTNGICSVYNANLTACTSPIAAVGEMVFHI